MKKTKQNKKLYRTRTSLDITNIFQITRVLFLCKTSTCSSQIWIAKPDPMRIAISYLKSFPVLCLLPLQSIFKVEHNVVTSLKNSQRVQNILHKIFTDFGDLSFSLSPITVTHQLPSTAGLDSGCFYKRMAWDKRKLWPSRLLLINLYHFRWWPDLREDVPARDSH